MSINLNQIRLALSIILLGLSITAKAQNIHNKKQETSINPPIDFEIFIADEAISLQNVFNKPIKAMKNFSVFNMLNYVQFYKPKNFVLVGQTTLNYEFIKNLSIAGGVSTNSIDGLRPTLGLNYAYISKDMLLILAPRFDLIDDKNFEAFLMYEFRPNLTKNTAFYSRVQALYNHNTNFGLHDRSYLNLRLGISIKKVAIGLGANFDAFGPKKIKKESYGLFTKFSI